VNSTDWPSIQLDRLPHHIAVIMDGNRRWALHKLMPKHLGHKAGVETLREVVKYCLELNIPYLTVYAFSTENWKRSAEEVGFLWDLFEEVIASEVDVLDAQNVRMAFIGDREQLNPSLQEKMAWAETKTINNHKLTLTIALNYGGRQELVRMTQKITTAIAQGQLTSDQLTEEILPKYLDTAGMPDPDLLIRTSGEFRISNLLLWQLAYAEIVVTDTFWPDFRRKDFLSAIVDFQQRNRRFGGNTQ
jgi:undecaprenyl diphosphate synthase